MTMFKSVGKIGRWFLSGKMEPRRNEGPLRRISHWEDGRGGTFREKGPAPPPPEVFDVIESLFAAFSGLRSRRRAFPHDARLMRFLHVTGCMLQKKPVHFVKMYWL